MSSSDSSTSLGPGGPSTSLRPGLLFIVSAPSGAGKTTLVERLVECVPHLRLSRSYTSRPARPGETDGVDYNFVTRDRFEEMIAAGDFLEWADVFGNLYGTCASDTRTDARRRATTSCWSSTSRAPGRCDATGIAATTVFVMPPSFAVLEQRLRGRSKDPEAADPAAAAGGARRGRVVQDYDYVVINDELDGSVDRLRAIVLAERARLATAWRAVARKRIVEMFDGVRGRVIDRSKLPNSFEFVVTAGARARQLLAGSTPRVAVGEHKKTTVAQTEVLTGVVEKVEAEAERIA